uniref:SynN domain-containing protein n=1 Tax=Panagrellus redivivus TaxID=6233 RepID=A0A7E4V134_PANRE
MGLNWWPSFRRAESPTPHPARDRLHELQARAIAPPESSSPPPSLPACPPPNPTSKKTKSALKSKSPKPNAAPKSVTIEMEPETMIKEANLQPEELFPAHIFELKTSLEVLEKQIYRLKEAQLKVVNDPVVKKEDKKQLENLIAEIKTQIKDLKPRVKQVENDIKKAERDGSIGTRTGAQLRIRKNQCLQLRAALNEVMELFTATQLDYRNRVSKRVKRQLNSTGTNLSHGQIGEMLSAKGGDPFGSLKSKTPDGRRALLDAAMRRKELQDIEDGVYELQDMFEDLMELVNKQTDYTDNIVQDSQQVAQYTASRQIDLLYATDHAVRSRHKRWCGYLIVFIFLVICFLIAVILAATLLHA